MKEKHLSRREMLKGTALGAGALMVGLPASACAEADPQKNMESMKGKVNHSVCRWCYNSIPLEELCERSKDMGIKSVEITGPNDWPTILKYGLTCGMGTYNGNSIDDGFNDPANHEKLLADYMELIPKAVDAGIPNLIVFSGKKRRLSEEEGIENCARGLEKIVKEAEKYNINIVMELLNSKVDHKDYQCDNTPWGVQLVEKLGAPNFKLLYDIYHMQIMEGDVIRTIRDNQQYIAHYHTGGVPGRHEINDSQELYYPAIIRAIVETGYTGYVAQEFVPTYDDKLAALEEGIKICEV